MKEENTNWSQSVTGVVFREGRVLLARHTYGNGKGWLIIPGGYVKYHETPQEALAREYREETGIAVEPKEIIGIRFNDKDWYVAFYADYVSGEARPDEDENSEVLWLDIQEALARDDVPDLTKKLIICAQCRERGLKYMPYDGNTNNGPYSLYGVESV